MSKVYIVNYLCRYSYEFKQEFRKYLIFTEDELGRSWRALNSTPLFSFVPGSPLYDTIWIHVWDDSPFSSDAIFERCLKNCNPKKNFFVLYGSPNGYSEGFFDELIQSRFDGIYPDVEKRNRHVFIVNPDTNEGMDKLVEEVRKAIIC